MHAATKKNPPPTPGQAQTAASRAVIQRNRHDRRELELEPIEAALKDGVGFMVAERLNGNGKTVYQVVRLEFKDGVPTLVPESEPMPYKPLAYVYLYETVQRHYAQVTFKSARLTHDAARAQEGAEP